MTEIYEEKKEETNETGLKKVDISQNPNMKLYRYMGLREFYKMMQGMDIESQRKCGDKAKTNSEGLCFLEEKTRFVDSYNQEEEYSPEECLSFLSGIVDEIVLVEFVATDKLELSERLWCLCGSKLYEL